MKLIIIVIAGLLVSINTVLNKAAVLSTDTTHLNPEILAIFGLALILIHLTVEKNKP